MIVRLAVMLLVGAALLAGRSLWRRRRARHDPPAVDAIAYLDVWERTVAATDDASLEDSALGGPDTKPRG